MTETLFKGGFELEDLTHHLDVGLSRRFELPVLKEQLYQMSFDILPQKNMELENFFGSSEEIGNMVEWAETAKHGQFRHTSDNIVQLTGSRVNGHYISRKKFDNAASTELSDRKVLPEIIWTKIYDYLNLEARLAALPTNEISSLAASFPAESGLRGLFQHHLASDFDVVCPKFTIADHGHRNKIFRLPKYDTALDYHPAFNI